MGLKSILKAGLKGVLSAIKKEQSTIMFESNTDFCDNTRAVYEYMIKNGYNQKYKLIWCVRDPKSFSEIKTHNVEFTSFKNKKYLFSYLIALARAKYIFYTHIPPALVPLKNQVVVNLWHGTPLKNLVGYIENRPRFDYMISTSPFVSDILFQSFGIPLIKIFNTGYPRNDQLFEKTNALAKLYIEKNSYDKVVLWMPTFRQSSVAGLFDCEATATGLPLLHSSELVSELNEHLKQKNQFMIIKLHPMQDSLGIAKTPFSNIKMLTNAELDLRGVQLYHLVGEADALLTDYSSIYFDYLLLDRPIGFIIDDISQYRGKRGFVVNNPLDYMPGMHIMLPENLYEFIDTISTGEDYFKDARSVVRKLVLTDYDNNSSERFLKAIGITL